MLFMYTGVALSVLLSDWTEPALPQRQGPHNLTKGRTLLQHGTAPPTAQDRSAHSPGLSLPTVTGLDLQSV